MPAIVMLKPADVNCSPHARFALPRPMFAATLAVASTKNTAKSPAQYQRFISNTSRRARPDCCANDMSLRPSTGRTHGIRLRMRPPASPMSRASGRVSPARGRADAAAAASSPPTADTTLGALVTGSGARAASAYLASANTSSGDRPSTGCTVSRTPAGGSQLVSVHVCRPRRRSNGPTTVAGSTSTCSTTEPSTPPAADSSGDWLGVTLATTTSRTVGGVPAASSATIVGRPSPTPLVPWDDGAYACQPSSGSMASTIGRTGFPPASRGDRTIADTEACARSGR